MLTEPVQQGVNITPRHTWSKFKLDLSEFTSYNLSPIYRLFIANLSPIHRSIYLAFCVNFYSQLLIFQLFALFYINFVSNCATDFKSDYKSHPYAKNKFFIFLLSLIETSNRTRQKEVTKFIPVSLFGLGTCVEDFYLKTWKSTG